MKLLEYIEVRGRLVCDNGLKIGGTKEAAGIGETDNPVIRHPITRLPYIPGSSLKGKLRSLMEWRLGKQGQHDGAPCNCGQDDCPVCVLFGSNNIKTTRRPGLLIFRDATLTPESEALLSEQLPGSFVEEKTEIAMNRKTGATRTGSLRQQERVPAGTQFAMSFSVRCFDMDQSRMPKYWRALAQAVEDLEKDYLGGCGTRGYGKVRLLTEDGKPLAEHLRALADGKPGATQPRA